MRKKFSKSDLKTGMVVENRIGNFFTVYLCACSRELCNEDVIIGSNDSQVYWQQLNMFNEKLEHLITRQLDIVNVYIPNGIGDIGDLHRVKTLLWEKKDEVKEMTIKEIEKELGYSIEIVEEN